MLSSNSHKPALAGFPLASVVGFAVYEDGRCERARARERERETDRQTERERERERERVQVCIDSSLLSVL